MITHDGGQRSSPFLDDPVEFNLHTAVVLPGFVLKQNAKHVVPGLT